MRKVAALAAVVTMSVGTLTACSGGGSYCSELQNYAEAVKNLNLKDTSAVERMGREAKKLSKSAPDDLKDDWLVMVDYTDKAEAAGGDTGKLAELGKADGAKIGAASAAIAQQAKDTCQVIVEGS